MHSRSQSVTPAEQRPQGLRSAWNRVAKGGVVRGSSIGTKQMSDHQLAMEDRRRQQRGWSQQARLVRGRRPDRHCPDRIEPDGRPSSVGGDISRGQATRNAPGHHRRLLISSAARLKAPPSAGLSFDDPGTLLQPGWPGTVRTTVPHGSSVLAAAAAVAERISTQASPARDGSRRPAPALCHAFEPIWW